MVPRRYQISSQHIQLFRSYFWGTKNKTSVIEAQFLAQYILIKRAIFYLQFGSETSYLCLQN